MNVFYVLLGGGLGAVARYLAMGWVQGATGAAIFPAGTLAVNVVGCLVIGILSQISDTTGVFPPAARALLFTGFLGGFTTFSTFGNDAYSLGAAGESWTSIAYVGLHVVLGIGAVGLGRVFVAQALG